MRSYLRRSSIAALVIGLIATGGILLLPEPAMAVLEAPLDPWFDLCAYVTPEEWQTFGNAPLALLWILSGVAALSITIGLLIGLCTGSDRSAPKPPSTPHG